MTDININQGYNGLFDRIKGLKLNTKAQESYVGMFIMMMLAVVVALNVVWPVIDQATMSVPNTSSGNLTGSSRTLVSMIPLFLVLTLLMMFIRPLL